MELKILLFNFLSFLFIASLPIKSVAQVKSPEYEWEKGSIVETGEQKPFWLIANRDGKYLPNHSVLYSNFLVYSEKDTSKDFAINYSLEASASLSKNLDIRLNQYYLDFQYKFLKLQTGARSESFGNHSSFVSGGSIIYSENARPLPKVALLSDGYIDIPYTREYIKIKGYIAHGWMGENRYVPQTLLHHKYGYIKFGGDLPVNLHYGLQHLVLWGGISPDHGELPNGFNAFKKIFFANAADSTAPSNEALNALGDHRGSHNFGVEYKSDKFNINLYFQSIFEDNSGMVLKNFPDGLWGISYADKNKHSFLQHAVYEWIYTKYQSGERIEPSGSGNDNYFNNSIYRNGWTNELFTIGTPFITSPVMNDDNSERILNSRVIGHHIGFIGWINPNLNYITHLSYTLNYGTHTKSFNPPKNQLSFLLQMEYNIKQWDNISLRGGLGFDMGEIYGDNFGLELSIIKSGAF
ncbi:MAG: capsule assembly Wzi family protein [Bacteroidales bacterium]